MTSRNLSSVLLISVLLISLLNGTVSFGQEQPQKLFLILKLTPNEFQQQRKDLIVSNREAFVAKGYSEEFISRWENNSNGEGLSNNYQPSLPKKFNKKKIHALLLTQNQIDSVLARNSKKIYLVENNFRLHFFKSSGFVIHLQLTVFDSSHNLLFTDEQHGFSEKFFDSHHTFYKRMRKL